MRIKELIERIGIPSGVTFEKKDDFVHIKGPKGSVEREFRSAVVDISSDGKHIVLKALNADKRKKRMLNTLYAHIANMVHGAAHGVTYKLKICSGHFPMNVAVAGETFTVKNFLGEKVPRVLRLKPGVKVKIDGQIINVEGTDIELVSQTAASIEKLTRRTGFDFNRFQDGIYIIEKAGEKV